MTRLTSIAAWQSMVDSGALEGRIAHVLKAVIEHGPGTSSEIFGRAGIKGNINLHRARMSELQERGLIKETSQTKCSITGRLALVWEFTGRSSPLVVKRRRGKLKAMTAIARRAIELAHHDVLDENAKRELIKTREDFKAWGGRL